LTGTQAFTSAVNKRRSGDSRRWGRWQNQERVVYFWHFVLWSFYSAIHFFFFSASL